MAGKFVYLALLLCVSQAAFGDTIENVRKEALKKVDDQLKRNKATNDYIAAELPTAIDVQNVIAAEKDEEGIKIRNSTLSEMKKIVDAGLKAAKTKEVTECITKKNSEITTGYHGYYNDQFRPRWSDIYEFYFRQQIEELTSWSWELDEMHGPFVKEATRLTTKFIPTCNNSAEIQKVVADFVKMADAFVQKKMSAFDILATYQKQSTQKFNANLEDLKINSKKILDSTTKAVEECLRKNPKPIFPTWLLAN